MTSITVCVSVDTEEDNWGSYLAHGATVENIGMLGELQDALERRGARPTYLVNHPPLCHGASVSSLGALTRRSGVEIGVHCHPWNTPPLTGEGADHSMMCRDSKEINRAKIAAVKEALARELGVRPRSFRAGRWGLGPTVSMAVVEEGLDIDCSVSPHIDWTGIGGPDFHGAPNGPYRCDPLRPLVPRHDGALCEMPTTIGFLRGGHDFAAGIRRRLEKGLGSKLGLIGLLDRSGFLARRWLSPETSSGETMKRLCDVLISAGGRIFLQVTFHSSALLPGATPFVRDEHDRARFLASLDDVLVYLEGSGATFATLSEAADSWLGPQPSG